MYVWKEKLTIIYYIFPYFHWNPLTSAWCFIIHPVFTVCFYSPVAAWTLLANNRQQNWCISGGSSWSWLYRACCHTGLADPLTQRPQFHSSESLANVATSQGSSYFRQTLATLGQVMCVHVCVFLKVSLKTVGLQLRPQGRELTGQWLILAGSIRTGKQQL